MKPFRGSLNGWIRHVSSWNSARCVARGDAVRDPCDLTALPQPCRTVCTFHGRSAMTGFGTATRPITFSHKNSLPAAVMAEIKPIIQRPHSPRPPQQMLGGLHPKQQRKPQPDNMEDMPREPLSWSKNSKNCSGASHNKL